MADLIVTNLAGQSEMLTDYKTITRKRRVNGERSLSFFVMETPANSHAIPLVSEEATVEYDGELFRIKNVMERTIAQTPVMEVTATHVFFDIIDVYHYDEMSSGARSITELLAFVFRNTGWTFTVIDAFSTTTLVDDAKFGNDNALSLFQKTLELFQAEFELSGTVVTIRTKIGATPDFQFRYKYNVKTLSRAVNTNDLSTYIKGYGKQNEDGTYVVTAEYTSPMADIYGIRHAKPVRSESITSQAVLLAALQKAIIDTPEVSIDLEFVDLQNAGFAVSSPGLGDTVPTIYEPLNVDLDLRIMEIEDYPESLKSPRVALSSVRLSFADITFDRSKAILDRIWDENSGKIRYNVYTEAVKRATEALNNSLTELEYPEGMGILARDPNDSNRFVALRSAGLGVTTDGGVTFPNAITAEGVNTALLTAGQINANNISVLGGGVTDYSLMDSSGFFAKGTAFRVERSDGYVSVNNGIIQHGFAVQGAYPPFRTAGIVEEGPWLSTLSAIRYENVQMYTFKHDSRYLVARIGLKTESTNYSVMYFDVDTSNGSGDTAANIGSASMTGGFEYWVTEVTMDLGVPDGSLKVVYVRLNTSNTSMRAYGRILNIRQEG